MLGREEKGEGGEKMLAAIPRWAAGPSPTVLRCASLPHHFRSDLRRGRLEKEGTTRARGVAAEVRRPHLHAAVASQVVLRFFVGDGGSWEPGHKRMIPTRNLSNRSYSYHLFPILAAEKRGGTRRKRIAEGGADLPQQSCIMITRRWLR